MRAITPHTLACTPVIGPSRPLREEGCHCPTRVGKRNRAGWAPGQSATGAYVGAAFCSEHLVAFGCVCVTANSKQVL